MGWVKPFLIGVQRIVVLQGAASLRLGEGVHGGLRRDVALIARRQMLPSRPCNFFGVTDQIAIDGVIRSDNRGSESLFPLYIYPSVETDSEPCAGPRRRSSVARANFAAPFIDAAAKALGLPH